MKRRPSWLLLCALCLLSYYAGRCSQYVRDEANEWCAYDHVRRIA